MFRYTKKMIQSISEHRSNTGEWEDIIVFNNEEIIITDPFSVAEYHCDYERSLKAVGRDPYIQSMFLNGEL